MRKVVYIAAAAGFLGAGSLLYSALARKAEPKHASVPAAVADEKRSKLAPVQEAKSDPIAGAIASAPPAPVAVPVAKPVVEAVRPPAPIPKPKVAAKPKQKVKPKSAVPPKKAV